MISMVPSLRGRDPRVVGIFGLADLACNLGTVARAVDPQDRREEAHKIRELVAEILGSNTPGSADRYLFNDDFQPCHPGRAGHHFRGGEGNRGSVMQGPKDAPAKALVWTQARKPDRDGHEHYQAKTAAGCYSVAAEYQPGKGFIGYRVTQSVADKRRVIASSITVDEGKALAQRDYEQGDADERTRQALQPMTIRVPLG